MLSFKILAFIMQIYLILVPYTILVPYFGSSENCNAYKGVM